AEDHVVAFDEQLDAEDAAPAEIVRDDLRDLLRALQRTLAHRMRLPGLAIVAVDLQMPDRRTEAGAARVAHGQHRDLVVELDEALDDHATGAGASAGLRVLPGFADVVGAFHCRLPFPRGRHHRLHHAGRADRLHRRAIIGFVAREAIRRRRQFQFFRGETADAFAIHRQARGARGRHHRVALALELDQRRRVDRLDLGDDEVRLLFLDHAPDLGAVEHLDHVGAMRDLHRRRILIAIDRDALAAEALRLDDDFLAELARAEQQDPGRAVGERRAERRHLVMTAESVDDADVDAVELRAIVGIHDLHAGKRLPPAPAKTTAPLRAAALVVQLVERGDQIAIAELARRVEAAGTAQRELDGDGRHPEIAFAAGGRVAVPAATATAARDRAARRHVRHAADAIDLAEDAAARVVVLSGNDGRTDRELRADPIDGRDARAGDAV